MWHCGNVIMWHVGHTVLWKVMEHDNNDGFPPNTLNFQKFKSKEISQNMRKKIEKRLKQNKNQSGGDEGATPPKMG